jgi:glycosyltransferase involved in cell wall biosynthesis
LKVDVVLITKNSATHTPIFERSLRSVYREVPVKRLIVVDGFSTDDTLKILERFPKVEVHQLKGNRAVARQYGIGQVETDWFMFVDDDVILCKDWFKNAQKHMLPNVGLIWGWDRVSNPHARNRIKVMYYLRKIDEYHLMLRNFKKRGGTHDALIRKEAVKDIQIPPELHVYEDWYIKTHVERKGFKCVVPPDLWCLHYLNPKYDLKNMVTIAKLQKKYRVQSDFETLRNFALALPKCLAILLTSMDLQACRDQWKMYAYNFIGRICDLL